MYPNLRAEMARENYKPEDLARLIEKTYDSAVNKLSGKTDFTRTELFKIRDEWFPELSLDYLFSTLRLRIENGNRTL